MLIISDGIFWYLLGFDRFLINIYILFSTTKNPMLTLMKGFSGLGGFLILAIGLGMLGVTIYGFMNSELVFNDHTMLIVLLVLDLLIITAAILGIIGVKKANGLLICVFQILLIVFFIVFLVVGLGAQIYP